MKPVKCSNPGCHEYELQRQNTIERVKQFASSALEAIENQIEQETGSDLHGLLTILEWTVANWLSSHRAMNEADWTATHHDLSPSEQQIQDAVFLVQSLLDSHAQHIHESSPHGRVAVAPLYCSAALNEPLTE